ncbi:Peptidase inhibitor I78 family [Streptococcus pneumoniae]|uniref:I78 family peptidase inhibitor n=1 Tax=Stutzerimonas stutzeri TaxID=316 RepID=UPI0005DC3CDA|nr:I78 family peptidase inhibitor [Stutzerimonas stutzeri]CJK56817.1 Peptidase inhibitor I78 family [Streptococcus pneumoniae]HAJ87142.1 peptidase inhibitor I78 family protein [Pseudomonas sp.]MDH0214657.1 I78 family peptidase inhibitor [Stutzerimonas stutzeri]MDH0260091.1 I78 family peptidase inhibitor [Stutzerimonas stutzeri]MDH0504435.1 I78 family peptidase inhibitor [Stutzerimonas stutzeri]
MYRISFLASIALGAALASGCQTTATPDDNAQQANTQQHGKCNSEAVSNLVGKVATPELLEQARDKAGADVARILRPDDVVTLEYNSQRLNLNTDANLTIERVSCG